MAKLVAKVYGDALFELALEKDQMDSLFEESQVMLTILNENKELKRLMNHPGIAKKEKHQIMNEILKGRVSDELKGFMELITVKNRYSDLTAILEYFIEKVKEHKKIGLAYVTCALELSDEQKEALVQKLITMTHYEQIDVIYTVDKALIGGLVIRIKDQIIDSSIQTKLKVMSKNLTQLQL